MSSERRRRGGFRYRLRTGPLWVRQLAVLMVPLVVIAGLSWSLTAKQLHQQQVARLIDRQVKLAESSVNLANQLNSEQDIAYSEIELPLHASLGSFKSIMVQQDMNTRRDVDATVASVLSVGADRPLWWVKPALATARVMASSPTASGASVFASYGQIVARVEDVGVQATKAMIASGVGEPGASVIVEEMQGYETVDRATSTVAQLGRLMIQFEGSDPAQRPAIDTQFVQCEAVLTDQIADLKETAPASVWSIWNTYQNPAVALVRQTVDEFRAGPVNAPLNLGALARLGAMATKIELDQANLLSASLITHRAAAMANQSEQSLDWTIALLTAVILATFGLVYLVHRSVRRPLDHLATRALLFSAGQLEPSPETPEPAEIAHVSRALNEAIRNFGQLKVQAEALAAGDLRHPSLSQAIPGRIGESLHQSVSRVSDLQQRLAYEASHDALTGLLNRRAAIEALAEGLGTLDKSTSVMFIDLDGFKQVNDDHGHRVGDTVLSQTAWRIEATVGPDTKVCRLGGDEFVVLFHDRTEADLVSVAERTIRSIEAPITTDTTEVRVTASVGVALLNPDEPQTSSELLAEADAAVYAAKSEGRASIRVHDEELRNERQAAHHLSADLQNALERDDGLELVYQPTVRVADQSLAGFEALCRWNRSGHGRVGPDIFIPAAERSDLIIDLDRWVLNQALDQLVRWSQIPGLANLPLHVNISGRHLGRGLLVPDVKTALSTHRVDASRLIIEVTETALVRRSDMARGELDQIRSLGVRVALDDFGTGYSTISQLGQMSVDALKIDKSFLLSEDIPGDREAIIRLVIEVAHSMGMTVVAEGVELESHYALLESLGCDQAQGYYLARPMPSNEVEDWAQANSPRLMNPTAVGVA